MKLYFEGEKFLTNAERQGSLQARIFEAARTHKVKSDPKHLYALVISTLKYKKFIVQIIKKSKVLDAERKLKEPLTLLLVHDLLFTRSGRIQSKNHPLKDAILRHKTRLQAELTKLKLKYKVVNLSDLIQDDTTPVRWFRVNTLKTNKEALVREFSHLDPTSDLDQVKKEKGFIYHDEYIPNLFGVNPNEKITSTDAYLKGRLIIQDRASCFPAHILHPTSRDIVVDACAAPGNKTTHLACHIGDISQSVIAFEKDPKRAKVLQKMCDKAGGKNCISVRLGDFTQSDPSEFSRVSGIVVDPSCSGSGIFGRAFEESGNETEETFDPTRLTKLSGFQFTIVKHALKFPNARKVVYSTCSIHAEENERVVADLLNDAEVKSAGWKLCSRDEVIPSWPKRGWEREFTSFEEPKKLADGCLRAEPKVDGGIGFFAAAFKRE